jgi:hypothetical protein
MSERYTTPGEARQIRLLVEQRNDAGVWHCVLDSRYVDTNLAPMAAKTAMSNLRMDMARRWHNFNLPELPRWPTNVSSHAQSVHKMFITSVVKSGLTFFAGNLDPGTWIGNPVPAAKHAKDALNAIGVGPVLLDIPKEGMSTLDMMNSATTAYTRKVHLSHHTMMKQIQAASTLNAPRKDNLRVLGVNIDLTKVAQAAIDDCL